MRPFIFNLPESSIIHRCPTLYGSVTGGGPQGDYAAAWSMFAGIDQAVPRRAGPNSVRRDIAAGPRWVYGGVAVGGLSVPAPCMYGLSASFVKLYGVFTASLGLTVYGVSQCTESVPVGVPRVYSVRQCTGRCTTGCTVYGSVRYRGIAEVQCTAVYRGVAEVQRQCMECTEA